MSGIPLSVDLVVTFAVQFVIFYFIMVRLNAALGLGRAYGALALSVIFTAFYALYTRRRARY
jgi:hypothetical protein